MDLEDPPGHRHDRRRADLPVPQLDLDPVDLEVRRLLERVGVLRVAIDRPGAAGYLDRLPGQLQRALFGQLGRSDVARYRRRR